MNKKLGDMTGDELDNLMKDLKHNFDPDTVDELNKALVKEMRNKKVSEILDDMKEDLSGVYERWEREERKLGRQNKINDLLNDKSENTDNNNGN
jgi:hypothetical protein